MMRSFLPNCDDINALMHCANQDCRKKAEPFTLKMCTACRSVSYCNVDCQRTHRKNHKHHCNQGAQTLKECAQSLKECADYLATKHHDTKEKSDDADDDNDDFFQPILPQDDCPICTLPLPIDGSGQSYNECCGNILCSSCGNEDMRVTYERGLIPCCAFCRQPNPLSYNETFVRIKKRMDINDSTAIFIASQCYEFGNSGRPKNPQKAFELCLRAAELGHPKACNTVSYYYSDGVGVPKDMAKSREYEEKAVKRGDIKARYNIGLSEQEKDNFRLASRHWLISAAAGHKDSLEMIAESYKIKLVTKKEYSTALFSYRNVHKDEWSIERETTVVDAYNCAQEKDHKIDS